jgi:hypothetical protein
MIKNHATALPAFRKLYPDLPKDFIARVAKKCPSFVGGEAGRGGRNATCLPKEFAKRLQLLSEDRIPTDRLVFQRGDTTYVARDRKTLLEECNVKLATVDRWEARGELNGENFLIEPKIYQDGSRSPRRRKFFDKAKILKLKRDRDKEPPEPRSTTKLSELHEDDFMTTPEAALFGVTRSYISKYSDWPDPKRRTIKKSPALNRVLRTSPSEWAGPQGNREATVRVGDILDLANKRDHPKIPDGGIPLKDAVPQLAAMGIKICETRLVLLVKNRKVDGGRYESLRKNLQPCSPWWVRWDKANQQKIQDNVRTYPPRGERHAWINGQHHWPVFEASEIIGVSTALIWRWIPKRFGGSGEGCADLKGNTISCDHAPIRHVGGDELLVLNGKDVFDIAEARTGQRPSSPPPPPPMPPKPPTIMEAKRIAKSGGRPKAKDYRVRLLVTARWERAKAAGIDKETFCRDEGCSVPTLDRYLDWLSKQPFRKTP